jgi:predicted Na+-dependent transporter
MFIGLIVAVFICSVAFGLIFVTGLADDESKAFTYAAVFAAVFVILNAALLALGYSVYRNMKRQRSALKCVSCGSPVDKGSKACPVCNAMQPAPTDDVYLEPRPKDNEIRPKK